MKIRAAICFEPQQPLVVDEIEPASGLAAFVRHMSSLTGACQPEPGTFGAWHPCSQWPFGAGSGTVQSAGMQWKSKNGASSWVSTASSIWS